MQQYAKKRIAKNNQSFWGSGLGNFSLYAFKKIAIKEIFRPKSPVLWAFLAKIPSKIRFLCGVIGIYARKTD